MCRPPGRPAGTTCPSRQSSRVFHAKKCHVDRSDIAVDVMVERTPKPEELAPAKIAQSADRTGKLTSRGYRDRRALLERRRRDLLAGNFISGKSSTSATGRAEVPET